MSPIITSTYRFKPLNNKATHRSETYIFIFLVIYIFAYSNLFRVLLEVNTSLPFTYSFIPWLFYFAYIYVTKKPFNLFALILSFVFLSLSIISMINYGFGAFALYRFLFNSLFPLLIIFTKLNNEKEYFIKFVKVLNIIIVINITYGIIDFVSDKSLQLFLGNLLQGSHYAQSISNDVKSGVYRLFSPFGHPLVNMGLILIFLMSNLILNHYKSIKVYFSLNTIIVLSVTGAFLCNSKFGIFILALTLCTLLFFAKKKLLNLSILAIITLFAINSSYFIDNVLKRFLIANERGDLSNGRIAALEQVFNDFSEKPSFFLGGGMGYSDNLLREVSSLNNIEVPLVIFMFDYGILISILIIAVSYIYPVLYFLKNKTFYILVLYTLIFIFFNSFNGLAANIGVFLILTFFAMLLINFSSSIRREKNV